MERLRTFIAIKLTDEIEKNIENIRNTLRKAEADVRWVKPNSTHLTIKFLGPTLPEQVQEIKGIISNLCAESSGFEIELNGLGVFPGPKNPRVLWVGITRGVEQLQQLQKGLDRNLRKLGFKPENRKFSPHITLGRFRSPQGKQQLLEEVKKHENIECGRMAAGSVRFIKSTLTPSGPIYENLFSAELRPCNRKEEN